MCGIAWFTYSDWIGLRQVDITNPVLHFVINVHILIDTIRNFNYIKYVSNWGFHSKLYIFYVSSNDPRVPCQNWWGPRDLSTQPRPLDEFVKSMNFMYSSFTLETIHKLCPNFWNVLALLPSSNQMFFVFSPQS